MSGYYARILSAVAGLVVLCSVLLYEGIRELPTNPSYGVGEIVAVVVGAVLGIFIVFCVGWVRNGIARDRKTALVARRDLRWLGDVQIDGESLARLAARSPVGIVEQSPQSSYGLTVSATVLELWGEPESPSPVVTLPLASVADGFRLPVAATAKGSGEFVLELRDPAEEIELALTGGLMGVYAPSPRSVDRFVDSILAARAAKPPLDLV